MYLLSDEINQQNDVKFTKHYNNKNKNKKLLKKYKQNKHTDAHIYT